LGGLDSERRKSIRLTIGEGTASKGSGGEEHAGDKPWGRREKGPVGRISQIWKEELGSAQGRDQKKTFSGRPILGIGKGAKGGRTRSWGSEKEKKDKGFC